jgi:hypothetical protein
VNGYWGAVYYKTKDSNGWVYSFDLDEIILAKAGDYVHLWCNKSATVNHTPEFAFVTMTGKIAASGNIQSLYNFDKVAPALAYSSMFLNCTSLVTAPNLYASEIGASCYSNMFDGCVNLVVGPKELPADILTTACYYEMFLDCTSLVTAPEIKATTCDAEITENGINRMLSCCQSMFSGCSALKNVPDLHLRRAGSYCCTYMFSACTSLEIAPKLPAEELGVGCYCGMFSECTSLTQAPALPATMLPEPVFYELGRMGYKGCYSGMFYDCSNLLVGPRELPAVQLTPECYRDMFSGCIAMKQAPVIKATVLADPIPWNDGYVSALYGCCCGMFRGCSSLTVAPELLPTTLTRYCYSEMFANCTSLIKMTVHFTSWDDDDVAPTANWVAGVNTTCGEFIAPAALPVIYGSYHIPSTWDGENFAYEAFHSTITLGWFSPTYIGTDEEGNDLFVLPTEPSDTTILDLDPTSVECLPGGYSTHATYSYKCLYGPEGEDASYSTIGVRYDNKGALLALSLGSDGCSLFHGGHYFEFVSRDDLTNDYLRDAAHSGVYGVTVIAGGRKGAHESSSSSGLTEYDNSSYTSSSAEVAEVVGTTN